MASRPSPSSPAPDWRSCPCAGGRWPLSSWSAPAGPGHARALLELAGHGHGPDAKAVVLTTALHLGALGPALMRTGIAVGVLALLAGLAWWRTSSAGEG